MTGPALGPTHVLVTEISVLIGLSVIVCNAPPAAVTSSVYSVSFNSYPLGAVFSLTLYVPCTKASEVTVPSAAVVKSNVVPSGFVTVNTAFARVIVLSSSSTFVNLILFARSPEPEPPEEALVKRASNV